MTERVIDSVRRFVDYRVNQLGVRVTDKECQLISKSGDTWIAMRFILKLPVAIPEKIDSGMTAKEDPIRVTAYQYMQECPGSDLASVLAKTKSLDEAMTGPEAGGC